jgi:PPP family 3-phenylpropionic acid transporter
MLLLAVATCALWLLFPAVHGFWPVLIVTLLAFLPFNGLIPVGDSLAMMVVMRERLDYGRVRLWGSLAFIASATLVGHALDRWPPTILPWLVFGVLTLTALSCATLPDARIPQTGQRPIPVRPLLVSGSFLLFLAAAALNQAAHTVYYGFATLHWKAAGLSDPLIGLLWSEGVIAEIVLFALGHRVLAGIGPLGLLLAAGLAGMLRWSVLGSTTDPAMIALVQGLHAATFACAHLGAMHFIQRAVPPSLSVRAQGIYAAIAVGLAPGLMMMLAGPLYERLHGHAFWVMGGLSGLAALAAWGVGRRWSGGRLIED